MKTRTILLTVIALCLLIIGTGCEKEPKYEIYENHEISACGIKDPLNNIEWLAKMEKDPTSLVNIMLLKNMNTEEYYFDFIYKSNQEAYFFSMFYDCIGDNIFGWYSITSPSPYYEDFFSDKEFVDVIWEVKNK